MIRYLLSNSIQIFKFDAMVTFYGSLNMYTFFYFTNPGQRVVSHTLCGFRNITLTRQKIFTWNFVTFPQTYM